MEKEKVDVGALLKTINIVDVIERYGIELHKGGKDYEGLCPFHSENTPSFTVSEEKQFFHCFGCGAHGDAIGFVMDYDQVRFKDAVAAVATGSPPMTSGPITPKASRTIKEEEKEWQFVPVPEDAPPPKRNHSKREKKKNKTDPDKWISLDFVEHYAYRDQSGSLLGYVSRFEYTLEGKREKEYIPQTWRRNINTGELAWRKIGFPEPRPLYGLDRLAAKPDAVVILCEGEKKGDAAERLLPGFVGMSFSGGTKAVKKTNFEPLRGRNVLLWRDADEVGLQAMDGYEDPRSGARNPGVADMLKGVAASVNVVDPPEGVPSGWDLWDAEKEGWQGTDVEAHIRAAARLPACMQPLPANRAAAPESHHYEDIPPPSDLPDDDDEPEPYRALGYDHGKYYYLAGRAMQVVELSSSSHSKLNLLSIAPLHFWQMNYPAKNDIAWDMAANALMRQCENAGVYDPEKLRGRGAWWDGGRALLHVGDRLIVDGESRVLTDPAVRYIYEAAPPLHLEVENPLSKQDAYEFVKLCGMLQWEKPVNGLLLAGWVVLAPICGALTWRPHIWITGAGGTGKSWVQSNIVVPCVGNTAIQPQGAATEAGIRQALGIDARPVTFDEAESEDQQAAQRMQGIMSLARQASSETGGVILKGSANGRAMSYRIRSMFGFSSIGVGVQQYADKTRITILGMTVDQTKSEEDRLAHFGSIKAFASSLLTEEYCARLRARAVNMIGVIRENAKVFATAGAAVIGSQRLGDQVGTILAGAYALHSNSIISLEEARAWVEKQDWSDETSLHEVKDEQSCIAQIMQRVVRVTGQYSTVERSIGELIKLASDVLADDASLKRDDADDYLLRVGIKVIDDGVLISNSHTGIKEILSRTPWASEWGRILKRLPGARPHRQERFGAGGSARSTFIPIEFFQGK